ncbi:MAG: leucine-rich repeat domain-containing protein [Crocosphaera sp.]
MTNEDLLRIIDQAADEEWEELDLSGQELTELPSAIGKLTKLKSLILGKWDNERNKSIGNNFTKLPTEIKHLKSLLKLDLRYNNLSSLPPEIEQLTSLQYLNLCSNQLSSLLPEIEQLISL